MPRVAAAAAKKGTRVPAARSPRMINERPNKYRLKLRALMKHAWVLGAAAGVLVLWGGFEAIRQSADPASTFGEWRRNAGEAVGLTIAHVQFENQKFTPLPTLMSALAPSPDQGVIGVPLLNYDLEAARERLMQIPWLAQATVERRLPDTLVVKLVEHDAFAIWQIHGQFVLIDRSGRTLNDVDARKFKQLPLVVGEGAPAAAAVIEDALNAQPGIQKYVTAAAYIGQRRWNLYLSNGAQVLLPEGYEAPALAKLAQLEAQDQLFERPLEVIDMRDPSKLIIRIKQDPAAASPAAASAAAAGAAPASKP